jgi:hypothetical protein
MATEGKALGEEIVVNPGLAAELSCAVREHAAYSCGLAP